MDNYEFKIPDEVLDEFHVWKGEKDSDPLGTYLTFLSVTDYLIVKLYEQITMYPEQAEQIREKFLEDNSETVHWREVAREEAGKLQEEMYEEWEEIAKHLNDLPTPETEEYLSQYGADSFEKKAWEQKHHDESSEE